MTGWTGQRTSWLPKLQRTPRNLGLTLEEDSRRENAATARITASSAANAITYLSAPPINKPNPRLLLASDSPQARTLGGANMDFLRTATNRSVAARPQLDFNNQPGRKVALIARNPFDRFYVLPAIRSYYAFDQNHRHLRSPRFIVICGQLDRVGAARFLKSFESSGRSRFCSDCFRRHPSTSFEVRFGKN